MATGKTPPGSGFVGAGGGGGGAGGLGGGGSSAGGGGGVVVAGSPEEEEEEGPEWLYALLKVPLFIFPCNMLPYATTKN